MCSASARDASLSFLSLAAFKLINFLAIQFCQLVERLFSTFLLLHSATPFICWLSAPFALHYFSALANSEATGREALIQGAKKLTKEPVRQREPTEKEQRGKQSHKDRNIRKDTWKAKLREGGSRSSSAIHPSMDARISFFGKSGHWRLIDLLLLFVSCCCFKLQPS